MDVFGIVYHIENPQQFWSELEDILQVPTTASLSQLDSALRRYVGLCAAYHQQYLQTPIQLDHACNLLLESELLVFHSERMSEMLLKDAEETTDPHFQLILFKILLTYGRSNPNFLRSPKKWHPLMPLFMDHILVEFNSETEDNYAGSVSSTGWQRALVVPIEARLRLLAVGILYEVLRVQKLAVEDLRIFDNAFIDHLFELVEQTRDMQDETLNYSVIKLIVALNEQFMVASLQPGSYHHHHHPHQHNGHAKPQQHSPEDHNRVLQVLMYRLHSSKTFAENMIFMLNRADRSSESLCMQLLVLKILFLLFTTKGTSEYFYTNDLCVLVDVFLRELGDLDEESESLRHTYLRVLHPLLTRTQLRTVPYKRLQIVRTLESLVSNPMIRDISPTTKRLVERCLSGEWCVQLRKPCLNGEGGANRNGNGRGGSPSPSEASAITASTATSSSDMKLPAPSHVRRKSVLKSSRSVENLNAGANMGGKGSVSGVSPKNREHFVKGGGDLGPMNDSSLSLTSVAAALPTSSSVASKRRASDQHERIEQIGLAHGTSVDYSASQSTTALDDIYSTKHQHQHNPPRSNSAGDVVPTVDIRTDLHSYSLAPREKETKHHPNHHSSTPITSTLTNTTTTTMSTTLDAAPKKRRKPPAVPVARTRGGGTITTIASSVSKPSPLSRVSPAVSSS